MDYSGLSNEDLLALHSQDLSKVSDKGLLYLHAQQEKPPAVLPTPSRPSGPVQVDEEAPDFTRGFKNVWGQDKQLLNYGKVLLGKTIGNKELMQRGMEGAEAANEKIEVKESDDITSAWKKGIGSVLGDWLPYQIGQGAGNILETLAVSGAGALAGAATGFGVGAIPGAVAGAVEKGLIKSGVKSAAEAIMKEEVAKQVAQGVAKAEAKKIGATAAETYVKNQTAIALAKTEAGSAARQTGAANLGRNVGLGSQALAHGAGETTQQAVEEGQKQAAAKGEIYDPENIDLSRVLPAAAVHSVADFIGEKIGLGALNNIGKSEGNVLVNITKAILATGTKELGPEMVQTIAQRYGANMSLTDADAVKDYINTFASSYAMSIVPGSFGAVRSNLGGDKPLVVDEETENKQTKIEQELGQQSTATPPPPPPPPPAATAAPSAPPEPPPVGKTIEEIADTLHGLMKDPETPTNSIKELWAAYNEATGEIAPIGLAAKVFKASNKLKEETTAAAEAAITPPVPFVPTPITIITPAKLDAIGVPKNSTVRKQVENKDLSTPEAKDNAITTLASFAINPHVAPEVKTGVKDLINSLRIPNPAEVATNVNPTDLGQTTTGTSTAVPSPIATSSIGSTESTDLGGVASVGESVAPSNVGTGAQPSALTRTKENTPVPNDEAMRDAGFTDYEIDGYKRRPDYYVFNQINNGYKYLGGVGFKQITKTDVEEMRNLVAQNKIQYDEDKNKIDAEFAKKDIPDLEHILGSDWGGSSSNKNYKDAAYVALGRKYGYAASMLPSMERILAKTQNAPTETSVKTETQPTAVTPKTLTDIQKLINNYSENPKGGSFTGMFSHGTVATIRNHIKTLGGDYTGITKKADTYEDKIPALMTRLQEVYNNHINPPTKTALTSENNIVSLGTSNEGIAGSTNSLASINNFIYDFVADKSKYLGAKAAETADNIKSMLGVLGIDTTGLVSRTDTQDIKTSKYFTVLDKAMLNIAPSVEGNIRPTASIEDAARDIGFKVTPTGFRLGSYDYELGDENLKLTNLSTGHELEIPLAHADPDRAYSGKDTTTRLEISSRIPDVIRPYFQMYDEGEMSAADVIKNVATKVRDAAINEVTTKNAAAAKEGKTQTLLAKPIETLTNVSDQELRNQKAQARQILKTAKMDSSEWTTIINNYTTDAGVDLATLASDTGVDLATLSAEDASFHGTTLHGIAIGAPKTNADSAFHGMTTAQEALGHVMETGSDFEQELAHRLLNEVPDTTFRVIETPDGYAPNETRLFAAMRKAKGAFFYRPNAVHVWGTGVGDTHQGVNNKTVLHEFLHAATVRKILLGLSEISKNSHLAKTVKDLVRIMNDVNAARKGQSFGLPAEAFTDVKEFVTYGLTEPRLQLFMRTQVKGKRNPSLFSRFVSGVRQLLGMNEKHQSALSDLIDATDQLMSAKLTTKEQEAIQNKNFWDQMLHPKQAKQAFEHSASATASAIDAMRKNPKDLDQITSTWKTLINARSNGEFGDVVGIMANQVPNTLRRTFLGAMTLDQIRMRAEGLGNVQFSSKLADIVNGLRTMLGTRNEMLTVASEIITPWTKLARKSPSISKQLARVMHLATVNRIDPDTATGYAASPTLAAMWDALGKDAQKIYRDTRDYYKASFIKYQKLLEENIQNSKLDPEAKKKALAALRQEFERPMAAPYFPLMREGRFWFKSGTGADTEYYMFESETQRNLFVRQYMKDKKLTGSLSEIFANHPDEFNQGNNYQQLYDSFGKSSKTLQDMISVIDNSTGGNKADLKDAIYQVFLATLPERSFRKQFMHRKNTPGFSGDALRNFARSSFKMSSQLSRLQYGTSLLNTLEGMNGLTKGDPNKPMLDDYIEEVADRLQQGLHPEQQNGTLDKIADVANQVSFLWYLTSPASALTNLSALPILTAPVLNAKFNSSYAKVAMVMGHYGKMVLSMKGLKSADGKSYTYPSIYHALTGDEKAAFESATAKGILSQTLVADLSGLSKTPSESYTGTFNTGMKIVGGLFHSSEKVMREIAFMSGYRLAKDQNPNVTEEQAIQHATDAMFESLGDFSSVSRARFFRHPLARVMFQFKSFAQMTTFYLVHNMMELTKNDPALRKAAATKLLGTLGMTGLFAGTTGMPLFSAIMYAFEKAFNLLKDDDEPEIDAKLEFRNFLADTFESKFVAAMVARGPIGVLTDTDLHSRIKLDDLWFRDVRQSKTETDWLRNFITDQLGPTVGLVFNAADAMKLIGEGHADRALEKLSPAILKNLFVASRYSREGVSTLQGDVVFAEDQIGAGDIWKQAFGFTPDRIADLNESNIAVKGLESRIKGTRQELLNRITGDLEHGEDIQETLQDIMNFNSQYPTDSIKAETIHDSLKRRTENSILAKRGLQLSKPLRPVLMNKADYARRDEE